MITRMGHRAETRARAAAGNPTPVTVGIHSIGDESERRWTAWAGF
jgi:hypothetical protein